MEVRVAGSRVGITSPGHRKEITGPGTRQPLIIRHFWHNQKVYRLLESVVLYTEMDMDTEGPEDQAFFLSRSLSHVLMPRLPLFRDTTDPDWTCM